MSFVSFAQNFEDVMLWRALGHIEKGFYIDVGAYLPEQDSVTKAFYDRGWNGINVEPHPDPYGHIQAARPRDVNLQLAVTDAEGNAEFYTIQIGLSTLEKTIAAEQTAKGFVVSEPVVVSTCTLASICQKHVRPNSEIHFLKIDVEGLEEAVIRGADWDHYRPWIVIVEATRPMTRIETHTAWEPMLLDAGYSLVYCDGLNRFYVANERAELAAAFAYPPNVFDKFMRVEQYRAIARADAATELNTTFRAKIEALKTRAITFETKASAFEAKANALQTTVDLLRETVDALRTNLDAMQASWSWRITRPLRSIAGAVSHNKQTIGRLPARWAQFFGRLWDRIVLQAGSALNPWPRVARFLRKERAEACAGDSDLTPRARQIYHELNRAIARRRPV